MQTAQVRPYSFDVVSAGVDWITCTAKPKASQRALQAQAEAILHEEAGAGVEITSARLRDYVGWRAPGIFSGRRSEDAIVVLTSTHALAHWKTVAQHATNVSRLDLQATVWTHGEQPALSRWYYQRVKRLPPSRGRPRSFSLIQTHPHGDTLYVGKRQSDCFGRIYDYATAHKSAPPRTLWRYEVEFKRDLARNHTHALLSAADDRVASKCVVGKWFDDRKLDKTWLEDKSQTLPDVPTSERQRDVLGWFETSLSKVVASAVRQHGLSAVLDALHLSNYVIPITRKE